MLPKGTRNFITGGLLSLLEERMALGIDNIALIRIEQLYPFPDDESKKFLALIPIWTL